MPNRFVKDSSADAAGDLPEIDRHFYEDKVEPSSSPFDDTYAFRMAAAVAKDPRAARPDPRHPR